MTTMKACSLKNNRGVALLIVLLVTALLIALVFEFAYATRVSLRAAVNFRDSQRAYFLARSGVNYFIKNAAYIKDNLPQNESAIVPFVSAGDTELRIKWEDEMGKINISDNQITYDRLDSLFELKAVDHAVLDRMRETAKENGNFKLLSELHEVMSDEEFDKVKDYLTVYTGQLINIYTASEDVLKSAGVGDAAIITIIADRKNKTEKPVSEYGLNSANFTATSSISRVVSYATVGGYTKRVEAVTGGNQSYWREL
jgi:type II secretory pathway component PulK